MYGDSDTLKDTYPATFAAVREYLHTELRALEITDSEDFDRDGIRFRVTLPTSRRVGVLVSHEFLSDFTAVDALKLLKQWRVASKVSSVQQDDMLVVTTSGVFPDSTGDEGLYGPTLREAASLIGTAIPVGAGLSDLQERVFSVKVDGTPLGDLPGKFAGPPEYYSRYSDDFADIVGSAYLLDAAGLRGFSLTHVASIPNLQVTFDDRSIFLEFTRIELTREKHAADVREYINGALRRLSYTDPSLSNAMEGYFISISLPDVNVGKEQRGHLISEIVAFVNGDVLRVIPKRSIEHFDKARFPILSSFNATVYVAEGVTSLSVQEAARSFDPYAPIRKIGEIVDVKSRIPYTAGPVWLGVSLAEYIALVPVSIMDPRRFPEINIERTPFKRIIAGSAGSVLVDLSKS